MRKVSVGTEAKFAQASWYNRPRRGARVAEWGGLENRCGSLGHRGFESHPLRCAARQRQDGLVGFRTEILRGSFFSRHTRAKMTGGWKAAEHAKSVDRGRPLQSAARPARPAGGRAGDDGGGRSKTGFETMAQARAESWDVVVLDI